MIYAFVFALLFILDSRPAVAYLALQRTAVPARKRLDARLAYAPSDQTAVLVATRRKP